MPRKPKDTGFVPRDGLIQLDLFGEEDAGPALHHVVETRESADSKRHRKQEAAVAEGEHPITKGPLHPEAKREFAHGPKEPFTCGTCWFRRMVGKSMKCTSYNEMYATASVTTNCLAEFPACPRYERFGGTA